MAIKLSVEVDEKKLRELVMDYLSSQINFSLADDDVKIQVKSKQNYRSEWETAHFRAVVEKHQ